MRPLGTRGRERGETGTEGKLSLGWKDGTARKPLSRLPGGCREPPAPLPELPVHLEGQEGPTGARRVQCQHRIFTACSRRCGSEWLPQELVQGRDLLGPSSATQRAQLWPEPVQGAG